MLLNITTGRSVPSLPRTPLGPPAGVEPQPDFLVVGLDVFVGARCVIAGDVGPRSGPIYAAITPTFVCVFYWIQGGL